MSWFDKLILNDRFTKGTYCLWRSCKRITEYIQTFLLLLCSYWLNGRAGRENIWPEFMAYGQSTARSVRHDRWISILRRIMLRSAGFIMHIFATKFQAITVQNNCYANLALIKGQCEAWEVSFFGVHFQAAVIRTCSLCRMKKKNLRLLYFEALAHKFDARSSAKPTVSQNSDFEEDFLQGKTLTCSTQQKVSSVLRTKRPISLRGPF